MPITRDDLAILDEVASRQVSERELAQIQELNSVSIMSNGHCYTNSGNWLCFAGNIYCEDICEPGEALYLFFKTFKISYKNALQLLEEKKVTDE